MAKIEESYEAVCDFFARDQFLGSCSRELYVHLKPKSFKNLEEMAKEADLFAEARGGVYTCVNKASQAIQSPRTLPFFLLVSFLDGYSFPNVLVKGIVAFKHKKKKKTATLTSITDL